MLAIPTLAKSPLFCYTTPMKKTFMIILALYTFMFTFTPLEMVSSTTATITVAKVGIEPLDAMIAMWGSLEVGKGLKKRTHQPKET